MADFIIYVTTGDRRHAGTDDIVGIILHDATGNKSSEISLDNLFRNDFERGSFDKFRVRKSQLGKLQTSSRILAVTLWRTPVGRNDEWFVDKIEVENVTLNEKFIFPVFRWVREGVRLDLDLYDTCLPQFDKNRDQRQEELMEKRQEYILSQPIPGGPVQAAKLPSDEDFSFIYKWDLGKQFVKLIGTSTVLTFGPKFNSINDMRTAYRGPFNKPPFLDTWMNDEHFALQRLAGLNHSVISLVKALPPNLPVTDEQLDGLLDDFDIEGAIKAKRLFIVDLKLLDGISPQPGFVLCAPIALFYLHADKKLRPVAIQLHQRPSLTNPVFTPKVHRNTWNLVKMWFNGADAAYHQSLTHLGLTHKLMEGVALTSHRQLSVSHPIFKLLAPHFLYIIAINSIAIKTLTTPDGLFDKTHNCGGAGADAIINKGFDTWRMDVEGTLPEDLRRRGVYDNTVLPDYYYRDDGLLIYEAILKYVTAYVDLYYTSPEHLTKDFELQSWAAEMVKPRDGTKGGLGLKGVPGNGSIDSKNQLVTILASIIYTCSVAHAATNFPQYDQYAFSPNYPCLLKGKPPSDVNVTTTEKDILNTLANRSEMMTNMAFVKLLSTRGTNSLGDFEVQYVYDPDAIKIVDEFRKRLRAISKEISDKIESRSENYDYINPFVVPNSISI